jgi:hypothetical protein
MDPREATYWTRLTRPRLHIDPETGEVTVRAAFRHKVSGKIRTWQREATIEEIERGEAKEE